MKKLLSIVCLSILLFSSCNKNSEDINYSCDSAVNAWAKSNRSEIHDMSRSEWLKLTENKKQATYRVFNASEKWNFWKDKLSETLTLNWNTNEKIHIKALYDKVNENPQWFEDNFSKSEDFSEVEKFCYIWSEYAKMNLGWNKQQIGSIIMSGNQLLDTKGTLIEITDKSFKSTRLKTTTEITETKLNCHCNRTHDFCDKYEQCTNPSNSKCNELDKGCGILLLESCDGRCNRS